MNICIIGLGYVGLPLAVKFAQTQHQVFGFDISSSRIQELTQGNIDLVIGSRFLNKKNRV